jgi:hypothetical protein
MLLSHASSCHRTTRTTCYMCLNQMHHVCVLHAGVLVNYIRSSQTAIFGVNMSTAWPDVPELNSIGSLPRLVSTFCKLPPNSTPQQVCFDQCDQFWLASCQHSKINLPLVLLHMHARNSVWANHPIRHWWDLIKEWQSGIRSIIFECMHAEV